MKIANYDTNLTDAQWAYLKPMLPKPAKRGRRPIDRRRILDAAWYIVKCGCPWRYLPELTQITPGHGGGRERAAASWAGATV
ncbi:MAG: transposase [Verrucomicrobiota bacterium]|jgi:transposase